LLVGAYFHAHGEWSPEDLDHSVVGLLWYYKLLYDIWQAIELRRLVDYKGSAAHPIKVGLQVFHSDVVKLEFFLRPSLL
jgi:hypothetical protein